MEKDKDRLDRILEDLARRGLIEFPVTDEFVSAFERRCSVVPDIGIDAKKLGAEYTDTLGAIESAAKKMDLEAFLASVEKLGPVLGKAMPRSADDVNELPDEVQ